MAPRTAPIGRAAEDLRSLARLGARKLLHRSNQVPRINGHRMRLSLGEGKRWREVKISTPHDLFDRFRSRKDLTVRVSGEQFVDGCRLGRGQLTAGHPGTTDAATRSMSTSTSGRLTLAAFALLTLASTAPSARAQGGSSPVPCTSRLPAPAVPSSFPAPLAPGTYAGAYADDFSALSARTRSYDEHPESVFSYCARNTAVYECLSYAADGTIRRNRQRSVLHGTAFAYQRQANDTLLLTNDHVAAWPSVTDSAHPVDGIPGGCKLVSQSLALVDNEHDDYPRDDVPVTVVVTDPAAGRRDLASPRAAADHPLEDRPQRRAARAERGRGSRISAGRVPRDEYREGHLRARSRRLRRLGS